MITSQIEGTQATLGDVLTFEATAQTDRPADVEEVCGYGYRCFALLNGALEPFQLIDIERHCRAPTDGAQYIYNFIFLPEPIRPIGAALLT